MKTEMVIASCQLPDVQEDIEQSFSFIINYAKKAEAKGARLVCFPECYLQGYVVNRRTCELALDLSSYVFEEILNRLAEIQAVLVIGLIEIENSKIYNTAVVVKNGKLLGAYRKVKLYGGENGIFEPGQEFPVFETDGLKFGINICYDLNFPECTDAVSSQDVDLIVCPCNNMMRRENAEKWKFKHNEIRGKRAIEAGTWLISSDVTGERDGRISFGPTALTRCLGILSAKCPVFMGLLRTAYAKLFLYDP